MTTEEQVRILAVITTTDESGAHFLARYSYDDLMSLEEDGLIEISRPTHGATGISYSEEHWGVEVTEDGGALVDAWPEYCP